VTTWTRAFRRAQIPLAYSEGFNPHAKIQVAASLPVGYVSQGEIMDIYLTEPKEPAVIQAEVGGTLPAGFELVDVEAVETKSPTLQHVLQHADYQVTVETDLTAAEIEQRIETLLAQEMVLQTRIRRKKKESYDLRPLLHELKLVTKENSDAILTMRVSAGQHGNLRPEAVLEALNFGEVWYEVERRQLIFDT
jgi:radical SAM-linked protein